VALDYLAAEFDMPEGWRRGNLPEQHLMWGGQDLGFHSQWKKMLI
jgi:hypothetical protein